MTPLLPCPFCRGKAWSSDLAFGDTPYVECDDCGARIDRDTPEEAIEAWNTRATPKESK